MLQHSNQYFVFTNGQVFDSESLLDLRRFYGRHLFVKTDHITNPVWRVLDEPKIFVTLLRFERKFLKTT